MILNIEANIYLLQSQISTVYKPTSKTLYVQTRTSPVSEFISLLPYLSEGNGSFPSTSETIQCISPTSFTSLILHPLSKRKSSKKHSLLASSKLLGSAQSSAQLGCSYLCSLVHTCFWGCCKHRGRLLPTLTQPDGSNGF